jgi:hypothetical protein
MKYKCHFNVEIAQGIVAYKYIYKYISKGHDRANIIVTEAEGDDVGQREGASSKVAA